MAEAGPKGYPEAVPSPELIPSEVRDKINRWSDYIDFWAVNWDYKDDTFRNQW